MISLGIGAPAGSSDSAKLAWAIQAIYQIARYLEANDVSNVTDGFTTTGTLTSLRTFDAAAGTAADVRNTLATLIADFASRGQKAS